MVQRFRGFYLEGIFLDDGQAVCDGIAKAYTLLCNMAGVNCYKVSGEGITGSGTEGHAWNKVGIYNEETEQYNYYMVDCTWNDISLTLQDNTELGYFLTHKNFLTKDDGRHIEKNPTKLNSQRVLNDASYDYFANKTITLNDTTYSMLIKNNTFTGDAGTYMAKLKTDLNAEYAKNGGTGLNYLEIKILNEFSGNFESALGGDWYIFSAPVSQENKKTNYVTTGYTTYLVLHK